MVLDVWRRKAWLSGLALMVLACQPLSSTEPNPDLRKITFDLTQLDEAGLYGPPEGKRSVDYEFCVPGELALLETVQAIDPSLTLYPHSPGRIGCAADQVLAIGNTHQPNAVLILTELARLDYIQRIDRVDWE